MTDFQDKRLTCVECGSTFLWTADEQAFFAQKGLTERPERCQACRQAHKERRGENRQKGGKQ